jgi:hypothetical protein
MIIQDSGARVEVAVMDPLAAMGAIGNDALSSVAAEVKSKLDRVIVGFDAHVRDTIAS